MHSGRKTATTVLRECAQESESSAGRAGSRVLRDSLGKTGRRLTSDPIRTSLGLLPSGPDPVGEWLVHRQSPGPYLGPKGPESKRSFGCHNARKRGIQYAAAHRYTGRPRSTGSSAFADDDALI